MTDSVRLLEFGALILGLGLLARLATRFGFSTIPLYLLAGLAFGRGGAVPIVTSAEVVEFGSEIGIILLLLVLGLEYSAEELTGVLRTSMGSGLVNAGLNFVPGFVAGLFLGWDPLAAAFLGGVTYVSSSGIVSKLLAELRWTGNRETPVVLATLVMEDLSMALFLPLVGVLVAAGGLAATVAALGTALVVVTAVLFVAVRYGRLVSRMVFTHSDETLLLTVLGMTFVVAGLLEGIHVSAAVGAFFVGLSISGPAAERAGPLLHPLRDLFAAVFFLFFGLQIDPSSIPPVLGVAIALAVVTGGTKLFAGWTAARRAGVAARGRWRAALLLLPRGEFSIAIAGIGVAAGVEPELGPLAATYVLLLAIAGPTALRIAAVRLTPRTPAAPRLG